MSAEEKLRRAPLENKSVMKALSEYKVRVTSLEKKLEEIYLNRMDVLWDVKRAKQGCERQESENNLLRHSTKDVIDGIV